MKRRFLRTAVGIAALLTLIVPADDAEAYRIAAQGGSPGRATIYTIQGSHWNTCPGSPGGCWASWLSDSGILARRSPRTAGFQTVTATYRIWHSAGGAYRHVGTRISRGSIPRGYGSVRLAQLFYTETITGYWYVSIELQWWNRAGSRIGRRVYAMEHQGDYFCATRFPCTAGPGWVYLGPTV